MSVQDLAPLAGENYGPFAPERKSWADKIGEDFERELRQRTPLQEILAKASEDAPLRDAPRQPLRMALSAIRDDLERRTREWRGSAQVVEQTLRQLVAAEQDRAAALEELSKAEARVVRTGDALTEALATFDETGESKNLDPRFLDSEGALQDLDRAASDLAVTQHCCRAAWKAYEEALAAEQDLRIRIKTAAV